jgi:hypothetical protein
MKIRKKNRSSRKFLGNARVVSADAGNKKLPTAKIKKANPTSVVVKDLCIEPKYNRKSCESQRDPRHIVANDATVQFL